MAKTAQTLIADAYYLSGIVSRDAETVSGAQFSLGLDLLNELLAIKTANTNMIPFFMPVEFNTVAGQEVYFVENLVAIETLTFLINNFRFPMTDLNRVEYFGMARAETIQSLPLTYHVEREKDGANIYMYFIPDRVYEIKGFGKISLDSVTASTDLLTKFELNYIAYTKYLLADYLCQHFNLPSTQNVFLQLRRLEKYISQLSPTDLTIQKDNFAKPQAPINYGDINFGHGWRPPGRY